jgi:nicotinamidase-related amidase
MNPNCMDEVIELVLATKENTKNVGWFITDGDHSIDDEVSIPFYETVKEGHNFQHADWKDQPVVRQASIKWRDDFAISWMERHMEMTQGFLLVGKAPGLLVLGEATHERTDLKEDERCWPDPTRMKGYIIPPGCGIIIKKGVWHDFPVSVGPELTVFIMNTKEVVDALMSMKEPAPMNFGDCYKVRMADRYHNRKLLFPNPQPFVASLALSARRSLRNDYSLVACDRAQPAEVKNELRIPLRPMGTMHVACDKVCLLLIDFQNDFLCRDGFGESLGNEPSKLRHIIFPTTRVLTSFRQKGLPVIFTREGHRSNLSDVSSAKVGCGTLIGSRGRYGRSMVRGQWGNDVISELKPLSDGSETIIDKPGKGSFYQTDLELVLKNLHVDTLIICGVTTEICVHSTVREASDRGFKCIVLEDCTASYFEEFHRVGLDMISAQGGILGSISDSTSVSESIESIESMIN